MTAAKGAAVCLLCVYMQKAYRILGGSNCCSASSVLSIHHFLKLLIHEVDCGLDNTQGVAVAATILLFHGAFTLSMTMCCCLMYHAGLLYINTLSKATEHMTLVCFLPGNVQYTTSKKKAEKKIQNLNETS